MKFACVLLALAFATSVLAASNKKVVCYYGSWAVYRQGNGKCNIEDLDPFVCTHLIYTFVGITEDGDIRVLDPWNDLPENWGKDGFRRFNDLRKINPELKTLIAIGGWNEGSERYSNVVNNPTLRTRFIKNAVDFTIKHGFDGFDLDWEYPNQRGGKPSDVQAYSELLKEMRVAFDKEGLLLTAAVAAAESSASLSYEISMLGKYLDFINVMTYDLHGAWESYTGHNSPLFMRHDEPELDKHNLNVNACINYWLANGAPAEKIILGIPLYGRTFTLQSASNNGLGAPTYGAGVGGPYTRQRGFLGYNEMCELGAGWTTYYNDEQKVPYAVKGTDWVGYDDVDSVRQKVEYANQMGLGGAMVWSIETDDFRGICNDGKFPLINTIRYTLSGETPPSTTSTQSTPSSSTEPTDPTSPTTEHTTVTTSPGPTTTPPPFEGDCVAEGFFRDPEDCSKFYNCVRISGDIFKKYDFQCPSGTFFHSVLHVCVSREQADCD